MHRGTVRPNSEKVRSLRLAKELTQELLSIRAGCSKKTIENIEKGRPCLPVMLGAVAGQLGTTLTDLIVNPQTTTLLTDPSAHSFVGVRGSSPPLPALVVGRDRDLNELKKRLRQATSGQSSPVLQVLTAVHGWPGVGKSTLAAALAHDPEIMADFPDGVLWTSLGPTPDLLGELGIWDRLLGGRDAFTAKSPAEAARSLASILRERRFFIVIDDVWQAEHGQLFRVGGRHCATLLTTRSTEVAESSAPTPGDIYKLDVLSSASSLDLLRELAPEVVAANPKAARQLVEALEGLPLAIQVAGRLLHEEYAIQRQKKGGRDYLGELLRELQDPAAILNAHAPADTANLTGQTSPTVAALLLKSVDRLKPEMRERYAGLSPAAPKPATFGLDVMSCVWEVDEERAAAIARTFVARGLLEPVGDARYQMHALLVALAETLCDPE